MLRCALEEETAVEEFVSCTLMHPLDGHVEVEADSEQIVRRSLLRLKDKIRKARSEVHKQSSKQNPIKL